MAALFGRVTEDIIRKFSRLGVQRIVTKNTNGTCRYTFTFQTGRNNKLSTTRASNHWQNSSTSVRPLAVPVLLSLGLFGNADKQEADCQQSTQPTKPLSDQERVKQLQSEDKVVLALKQAKLAMRKKEWENAERFYHVALDQLAEHARKKVWSEAKILQTYIYIYDHMANLAMSLYQFDKAEKLYKETMKGLLEQKMEKDHNAIIDISLKLAMLYAVQERHQEAEAGYKYCYETQQKKISKMSVDEIDEDTMALLGLSIDAYARFLLIHKRYQEATESLLQALDIAKKVFTDPHPQLAVLLNDIATVASVQEDYKIAKDYAVQAIRIAEKCASQDLPLMYTNLATIYSRQGKTKEARGLYNRAIKAARKQGDKEVEAQAQECLDRLE